ncbi:MAG TPA: secretin N-terminal domain-containing protein [Verrucomicrobiae bacterium]
MKTILLTLLLALASLELPAQPAPNPPAGPGGLPAPGVPAAPTAGTQPEEMVPPRYIDFQGVDVSQVLQVYAKLVNRTVLHAQLPDAKIVLETQTALTKTEAIEALQAVLAMNNVSVVNIGDKFVKAGPSDQANTYGAEFNNQNATNLPDLGTYVTRIVQLHYVKPSQMMQALTPFQKLPNSIIAIDDNGILIIRDYAENVKRMLEMIAKIDIDVPAVYVSEVIPIRYAKVDEIASVLNNLGGSGGSTVSIGTAPNTGQISGFGRGGGGVTGMSSGVNSSGGINGSGANPFGGGAARSLGGATANPNGTPSSPTSYTQRLNNLLGNRSQPSGGGGNEPIQLFGQTKIIPDESSSSLLVFATRQDMDMITNIIAKLDVPLAQVLVEAVIMDVTLGSSFNFGVSAAQNPKTVWNPGNASDIGSTVATAGGANNGQSFLNFLSSALGTNGSASTFASSLPGGFSYFGNIGPSFDLALQAAAGDNHASIIQRPRIQTSQAKLAQFFVGETKPYVTSTYNGYSGGYGGSSYSQLSVGVELDVTPYINPDGEVTMDIQQEIDDFNGTTAIAGVGDVPNTIKRTLNTTITVRDRDTVMLGGFIKSDKSTSKSGVPFLQDIPLIGNLFSQRNDAKDRQELIVLMRPTVLKTPELAARNTIEEARRLPGISAEAAEAAQDEAKLIEAERKTELKNYTNGVNTNGFFNMFMPPDTTTNAAPADSGEISAPENMTGMKSGTPMDSAAAQEKARAEFLQKDAALKAALNAPPVSPAQKAKLNVLLNSYMAGKISSEEYAADRQKILSEGR